MLEGGRNTPRSGRSALDRASGFGHSGRANPGTDGHGFLVRGGRIEPGDHVKTWDGSVKQVKHVPVGAVMKRIEFHDGTKMTISPDCHYSVKEG